MTMMRPVSFIHLWQKLFKTEWGPRFPVPEPPDPPPEPVSIHAGYLLFVEDKSHTFRITPVSPSEVIVVDLYNQARIEVKLTVTVDLSALPIDEGRTVQQIVRDLGVQWESVTINPAKRVAVFEGCALDWPAYVTCSIKQT